MNKNTAIILGVVVVAGAAAWYLYKKSQRLPVGNTASNGTIGNNDDNTSTGDNIGAAWDALSGLFS